MADKDVKDVAEESASEPSAEKDTAEESSGAEFETVEMTDMTEKEHKHWLSSGELPERHRPKEQREKAEKKADAKAEVAKAKEKEEADEKADKEAKEDKSGAKAKEAKAQTEDESDPSKKDDKQKPSDEPKGDRAAKRSTQLTNEIRDLLKQRKAAEEELAEMTRKKAELAAAPAKSAKEPEKAPELVMPDINDFDSTAEWRKAMSEYERKQKEAIRNETQKAIKDALDEQKRVLAEEARQEKIKAENAKIEDAFKKEISASAKRHSDFADVAFSDDIPGLMKGDLDPIMDAFILEERLGSEVLYALGKDHELAEEIRDMTRFAKANALVKLRDQIEESLKAPAKKEEIKDEGEKKPPPISRAPKPPTDISGPKKAPEDELSKSLEEDDFRAYQRAGNARELALKKG